MPYFSIKFGDKNKLRDSLAWLFLKYACVDDNEQKIQLAQLEPALEFDSDNDEDGENYEEK